MRRITVKSLCAIMAVVIACSAVISVFAYYTEYSRSLFDSRVEIELIFDKLTETNSYADYDKTAKWGTEKNPYVISNLKFFQNLVYLQNSGFFYRNFYKDENGNVDYSNIPYFVVSTNQYKPVVIDGKGATVNPVGTEQYPFIGSIKGVRDETVSNVVGDTKYSSDISAIYGLTVESKDNSNHDIGLFSYIGHMGDKSVTQSVTNSNSETVQAFKGTPSTVSDMLLVDISVSSSHSLSGDISSWLSEHVQFLTGKYNDNDGNEHTDGKKDTHHIGIFAGHAEYANIKNISVYYTDNTICAINLNANGSQSNFYSSTGIIGAISNLNPEVADNSYVIIDSGIGNDLSYTSAIGGGKLSGGKQGFVLAEELYKIYHYDSKGNAVSTTVDDYSSYPINNLYAYKDNTATQLVQKKVMAGHSFWNYTINPKDYYYFYDGVFTFALSNTPDQDMIKNIWPTVDNELQIPKFYCEVAGKWEYGTLQENSYIATLTPATSVSELSGKPFVICYRDTSGNLFALNKDNLSSPEKLDYVIENSTYKINCKTDKTYIEKLSVMYNSNMFTDKSNPSYHIGAVSSGYEDSADFNLYYGNNSETTDGTITLGITQSAPQRYTNNWSIVSKNNKLSVSINAAYNSSRSIYWLLYYRYNRNYKNKYLIADSSGFSLADSDSDANLLQLCTVDIEWTSLNENDPNARKGYRPNSPGCTEYAANEYVLYANEEFQNTTGAHNNTRTYTLKKLSELENWQKYNLSEKKFENLSTLSQEFALKDGIDIGNHYSGWFTQYYDKGIVTAPVGSDGTATDMPTGTIAFNVSKLAANKTAKIRVIVVASTDQNQSFGLWKVQTTNSFLWVDKTSFDKSKPLKSFVIPNTRTLSEGDSAEYINVMVGDQTKRTYLNGDSYLVAYEFEVESTGIYIIGSTEGPMNISYFSAEGVASSAETQIGSIDFVYASSEDQLSNKIISVNQVPQKDENGNYTVEVNESNYNLYYYPSLFMPFTNHYENPTININYEQLFVRRFLSFVNNKYTRYADFNIKSSDTTNNYMDVSFYSMYCDTNSNGSSIKREIIQ